MKRWSLRTKLLALSMGLVGMLVTVGGVLFYGISLMRTEFNQVAYVALPAVRNMSLVDMMHDGLRAVVYRSFWVADNGTLDEKKETAQELVEFMENMNKYLDNVDQLKLTPETKKAIEDVKPALKNYLKESEEQVALVLSGRRQEAVSKLSVFNESFELLEKKLGSLGDLIEQEAIEYSKEGVSQKLNVLCLVLVGAGTLLGLFLSFLIIRDLVGTLNTISMQLSASSAKVSEASVQSANSATSLSEAASDQASSLQKTAASIEQISAMVNRNAESAVSVTKTVNANQETSDEGQQSVSEMLTAIGEIKAATEEIASQMELSNRELEEIVKIISTIGDKTKVINDIVFQTKLLSFNASVEAARAGEHGKGFAVVAEEVGKLAQMSGNASKEISDMLSQSTQKVDEMVRHTSHRAGELVKLGKERVSTGEFTAQKCQQALSKIAENAHAVTGLVNEIAVASKEQAQGVQEVNKAVTQIDAVTQKNSSVAQESSTQAETLNDEAQKLFTAVTALTVLITGKKPKDSPHRRAA